MKKLFPIACLAAAAVFALLWQSQQRAAQQQSSRLQSLQLEFEQTDGSHKQALARVQELEKEVATLRDEARAAEKSPGQARASAAAGAPASPTRLGALAAPNAAPAQEGSGGSGMSGYLSKMMKDPEMRKMMEGQQRMAVGMLYDSLVKKLDLDPDEEKQFKDLLLAAQMENVEQAGSIMAPGATNKTELLRQSAESRAAREETMKSLLGEERYGEYQEYNQTLGERMLLNQFAKEAELSPGQTDQLLALFREEKESVRQNQGVAMPDPSQGLEQVLGSPDMAETLLKQQEEVNSRVLERAGGLLAPAQIEKMRPALKSQIEMQRLGMKMAKEMLGGSAPAQQPPSPTPVTP